MHAILRVETPARPRLASGRREGEGSPAGRRQGLLAAPVRYERENRRRVTDGAGVRELPAVRLQALRGPARAQRWHRGKRGEARAARRTLLALDFKTARTKENSVNN